MVGELQHRGHRAPWCIALFLHRDVHQRCASTSTSTASRRYAALIHDVLVTLCLVVILQLVRPGQLPSSSLPMIAAFLTIIGYSINDTIVIFDRIRENLANQKKLGDTTKSFADTINISINQTLARTILTSCTTFFVVGVLFAVNYNSGSELEGFAFAMIIGIITGTYSTIFVASPVVMWLRSREKEDAGLSDDGGLSELAEAEAEVRALATSPHL